MGSPMSQSASRQSADDRQADDYVVLGKLTSPYGIKGWMKVFSYTSPMEGILDYAEWVIRQGGKLSRHRLQQGRRQGKGLVAQLDGIDSRDTAEAMAGAEILLPKGELPALESGDYYWYQLEGLKVITLEGVSLGRLAYLFETGANDVMVVKGGDAPDDRERLLPYLPNDVIKSVDLEAGEMRVDWDPEF
ncbi:ribosome maturation factor RimM [Halomonas sp. V046]|uniref:ribosome maturation factor RimM n=1 Tax=Halomonas sp. V046 TaxID=3459611 RepID=UPI0040444C97